eukprot:9381463-Heterocapsa_arctica.AAC.1
MLCLSQATSLPAGWKLASGRAAHAWTRSVGTPARAKELGCCEKLRNAYLQLPSPKVGIPKHFSRKCTFNFS